ncbi:hypothetical protein M011DRAFT_458058 [Sporormia fimetaria CBS 119925]|uniref:Uncharacterized protein n=1 Tax=Sporormia fimetaria CBS 119925 TaxID=1340428 RepID=A0A6A6VC58_9PLEO|nr:hypothetical protein M011DRAFT_458058 [Sporormia fimetaria CBS 119925]
MDPSTHQENTKVPSLQTGHILLKDTIITQARVIYGAQGSAFDVALHYLDVPAPGRGEWEAQLIAYHHKSTFDSPYYSTMILDSATASFQVVAMKALLDKMTRTSSVCDVYSVSRGSARAC